MFTEALETAFKTKLKAFAQTNTLAVDWGDEKEYKPVKANWLRPRLNPAPTVPGPTQAGPLRGTLRGMYSVECMTPIESGHAAAYALADDIGQHFMPDWSEPGYLDSDDCVIRLRVPTIDRLDPFPVFNRAVIHIPYLVYAMTVA
ncbi:MAG: hypothetical protein KAH44_12730 [Oricola sp.]|jgi:hypothetical protein|nr:hypothetical protein [Oricola sp.]